MATEELRCKECGDSFSSDEIIEEHFDLEHPEKEVRYQAFDTAGNTGLSDYLNVSGLIGFAMGVVLTAGTITGAGYVQEQLDEEVKITVVTCGECRYERFKTVTDRMMETDYREVDYQSKEGQILIDKYNLSYIPGFIYEKDVESHENFTQIRNALIKHKDVYTMSDSTIKKAQRFSEGKNLN